MPRWGAPQAPQGPDPRPDSGREDPPTAKTESNFSTCRLAQRLHTTEVVDEATIFSKVSPQSRHLYSKRGILDSSWQYNQPPGSLQGLKSAPVFGAAHTAAAFFLASLRASAKIP